MIPFSGFMPANGSMAEMAGERTGTTRNGPLPPGNDDAGSFLTWVHKLIKNTRDLAPEGEIPIDFQSDRSDAKGIDGEQLLAMIADVMDQSEPVDDSPNLQSNDFNNGQDPAALDEGIVIEKEVQLHPTPNQNHLAILFPFQQDQGEAPPFFRKDQSLLYDQRRTPLLTPGQETPPLTPGQETPPLTPGQGTPPLTSGQGTPPSIPGQSNSSLPVVEKLNIAGNQFQADGQNQTVASDRIHPGNISELADGTETGIKTGDGDPAKAAPFNQEVRDAFSTKPTAGEKPSSPRPPIVPADEGGKDTSFSLIEDRLLPPTKKTVKAGEPVTPQQDSLQTRGTATIAGFTTDQQPASAEDDASDCKDTARNHFVERIDTGNTNEKEWSKGISLVSIKSEGADPNRSQDAFQALKTSLTGKSNATPASELTRAQEPGVKAFQSTVMDQIVDKAGIRSIQGRSEIQIRLKPEFLGNVQMNIGVDKEQLVVRMITDQTVVKEIIETNLHHLKAELQNHGLTIDRFDVVVNPDAEQPQNREPFAQMSKNPSFQNGRRQDHEPEPETKKQDPDNRKNDRQPDKERVNYFA